jgi:hypothetical protein
MGNGFSKPGWGKIMGDGFENKNWKSIYFLKIKREVIKDKLVV